MENVYFYFYVYIVLSILWVYLCVFIVPLSYFLVSFVLLMFPRQVFCVSCLLCTSCLITSSLPALAFPWLDSPSCLLPVSCHTPVTCVSSLCFSSGQKKDLLKKTISINPKTEIRPAKLQTQDFIVNKRKRENFEIFL